MISSDIDQRIGFIGLGAMGVPISLNLIKSGYSLKIYNRSEQKQVEYMEKMQENREKVQMCRSALECLDEGRINIVISMVSNDEALEEIVCDKERGLLKGLKANDIHLSLSTVSPQISDKMQTLHSSKDAFYISCPVFGRPPAAAARKLIAVASGDNEAYKQIYGLLECLAQKIFYSGEKASNSNILKLCGNFMILSMIQMQAEAFTLAESAGISRQTAYQLFSSHQGVFSALPIMQIYGEIIANQQYQTVGFTLLNGLKDVNLINQTAVSQGVQMPIANIIQNQMQLMIQQNQSQLSHLDWSSFASLIKIQKK